MAEDQEELGQYQEEDLEKLKEIMMDFNPEDVKTMICTAFDMVLWICMFFGIGCMFAWQGGYFYAMKRMMKSQKVLEDWFMGPVPTQMR